MRVLFAGTPGFAAPVLAALDESAHGVAGVITPPDRPAGRGRRLRPSAVKAEAIRRGLPVMQPDDVKAPSAVEALRALEPDALILAAYGRILSQQVLDIPRLGALNVHLSLLPKYRGAAPVARAIQHGETVTGVTLIRMVRRLDAGPILLQENLAIEPGETAGALRLRLGRLGAELAVRGLDLLASGRAVFREQDHAAATAAPALTKADGLVDWRSPADALGNLVRAMNPWPMAYTFHRVTRSGAPRRLILLAVSPLDGDGDGPPGEVVALTERGPLVQTGRGALRLDRVKPAGGGEMDGAAYVRGHRLQVGDRFVRPEQTA